MWKDKDFHVRKDVTYQKKICYKQEKFVANLC